MYKNHEFQIGDYRIKEHPAKKGKFTVVPVDPSFKIDEGEFTLEEAFVEVTRLAKQLGRKQKMKEGQAIYIDANDALDSGDLEIVYEFGAPKEFLLIFKRKASESMIALDKQNAKELALFIMSKL